MAYQGVLVIHRADQDEFEPLDGHQEDENGKGWWDRRKESRLPSRVPIVGLPDEYLCDILCLPDGQLIFRQAGWSDEQWGGFLGHIQGLYPGHLASVVMCHS